ncbi:60S ribosomal protein L27 [Sesamum angolense]|uniref:60S ribosomal protein L27 n=1 Tax=Sesamum angolense TaxID=2727404 RepID=A0AAE1WSC4_9LAMI|nr:60S ribosomal protein L27 [Sesamum angolense]
MVKFLKPNKAVILLQGRFAGHKATIVRNFDDGTRDRAYGHCLVAGIAKYPSKIIRKDSAKKQAKKSRVKAFIKLVNYISYHANALHSRRGSEGCRVCRRACVP